MIVHLSVSTCLLLCGLEIVDFLICNLRKSDLISSNFFQLRHAQRSKGRVKRLTSGASYLRGMSRSGVVDRC